MSDPKGWATGTVQVSISINGKVEEVKIIFTPDCDHFAKNDDAKYAVFLPKSSADCPAPRKLDLHGNGTELKLEELLDNATKDKLQCALLGAAANRSKVEITVNGDYRITGLSMPA